MVPLSDEKTVLVNEKLPSHIGSMNLELTDEETGSLARELRDVIAADRYFLSPRVQTLREFSTRSSRYQSGSRYHHRGTMSHHGRNDGSLSVLSLCVL